MTLLSTSAAFLFEHFVQPVLYALGWMALSEAAYEWIWAALAGGLFMLALVLIISPLERWRPAEPVTDRRAIRTDRWYTAWVQLGVLPLIPIALLVILFDPLDAWLRQAGFTPLSLEQAWPALHQSPALAFAVYVLVIDFTLYWLHRSQHSFRVLWELHAVHHSQQQMTFWSDAREHVLSFVYFAFVLAALGLLIGAGRDGAFIVAAFVVKFVQAFSHANVRLSFGAVGNRLLVSPQFHRVHHAVGIGHEGKHKGCNFGSTFAIWDVLFGTANLRDFYPRTGIRNQREGRDYGQSLWQQQCLAIKSVLVAMKGRAS
jgi:sterol desaturase/sphingolipid hydroxylase (fatty acid hydroxylase superfamily)